ncbi:hypothetical protein BDW02DRAFT_632982 [Decorospora gaudefroyi]|uniref:Uncharacterized protein n=1 Tax=Decorospora gaudefroyi TaxID=184978 RepID=A0A6A5K269_9PLEO|nr:hypothetical protein BDW02DRAFT_632982 [Decorospora gaudefroyi]
MSLPLSHTSELKIAIDPHWIQHTLIPYIYYALSHVISRDVDISPYVQRAIEFCMTKPDYPTDGDDLLFERIFYAIENRLKGLPNACNVLTDNVEPLARFLIRRAQLKGPYELLDRGCGPSDAWERYEQERLARVAAEKVKAQQSPEKLGARRQGVSTATATPPSLHHVADMTSIEHIIDPRLLYALPGQFVTPGLPGTLTVAEDQFYRHRNQEYQRSIALRSANVQQALRSHAHAQTFNNTGRGTAHPDMLVQQLQQPHAFTPYMYDAPEVQQHPYLQASEPAQHFQPQPPISLFHTWQVQQFPLNTQRMPHPGLPFPTQPTGIPNPTSILELVNAQIARNANVLTPRDQAMMQSQHRTNERGEEGILAPPQQPVGQLAQYAKPPPFMGFALHPGYSNVMSTFAAPPVQEWTTAPVLRKPKPKRKEGGPGSSSGDHQRQK